MPTFMPTFIAAKSAAAVQDCGGRIGRSETGCEDGRLFVDCTQYSFAWFCGWFPVRTQ